METTTAVNPQYNYSKLLGRIRERGYTQQTIAPAVKMSLSALNLKLANRLVFRQNEMMRICNLLDIPVSDLPDYFFCIKSLDK